MRAERQLVLIEPYISWPNGHWRDTVEDLVLGTPSSTGVTVFVTPAGGTAYAQRLRSLGARVETLGRWPRLQQAADRFLSRQANGMLAGVMCEVLSALREFEALRTLASRTTETAVNRCVVVLTAHPAIGAALYRLTGIEHLRFVHDAESALPRGAIRRLGNDRPHGVTYIAPTAGVAAGLKQADGYTALVQPFAPFRAARRLSEAERESARRRWNVEKDAVVLLLLGGWWRAKNSHVVLRAVASAETPATLIVAGTPLDIPAMNRLRLRDDGRKIKAIDRPLNQRELRELYALASATIVSRRPGVLKESGLVLDAANYGVPLLISDHDEHLNDQLRHEEWVRVFPSGDECALAEAIDGLRCNPVARPDADAPLRLGLKCPTGLIDYFFEQAGANGLNDLR